MREFVELVPASLAIAIATLLALTIFSAFPDVEGTQMIVDNFVVAIRLVFAAGTVGFVIWVASKVSNSATRR